MLTPANLVIGAVAAWVAGASKTALPGAGILVTPLIAIVVTGRLIPGATLPLLIAADLFAVAWYRQHARWDLLGRLMRWVWLGFAAGAVFFIVVGDKTRSLELAIGIIVMAIVVMQAVRVVRARPPAAANTARAAGYGTAGGFTTFVSNTAGPVMNTYMISIGLDKRALMGTSAWYYLTVNVAKIPFYVAIGLWSAGGPFFTGESLVWNAVLLPAVVAGAFSGRWLFQRLSQRVFLWTMLVLSAAGAAKLLIWP